MSLAEEARNDVKVRANLKTIESGWDGVLQSIMKGSVSDYAAEKKGEYENIGVARALIDEVQRSEAFVVKWQLPVIQKIRYWTGRFNGLKRRLGL